MYQIDLKEKFDGLRFGIRFKDGIGTTRNERVAKLLRKRIDANDSVDVANTLEENVEIEGYDELSDEEKCEIDERRAELVTMSVKNLRKLAGEMEVPLGSRTRRDNIASLIIKKERGLR